MLINRANKYVSEPTPLQEQTMGRWVGAKRFVVNAAIEERGDAWRPTGNARNEFVWGRYKDKRGDEREGYVRRHLADVPADPDRRVTWVSQKRELTKCREDMDWLDEVPCHLLQNALIELDKAFERFFLGLAGYPQMRKKYKDDSFTFYADDVEFKRLNKNHGAIKLPKIGWVKFCGYRPLGGRLRSVTFRRKAGKWFTSVMWDKEIQDPPKPQGAIPVGIDCGVVVFAALSTGEIVDPVNAGKKLSDKRAKLQRKLARQRKFSNNWSKTKGKIARLDHKATNRRRGHAHRISRDWAKNHDHVKMEDLRIPNMTATAKGTVENPGRNVAQKSGLNRSILDQGWGMTATFTRYKMQELGKIHEWVAAPHTSQRCPPSLGGCGHVSPNNRPTRDRFCCGKCGLEGHADVFAAVNVSQASALAVEPPKRIRRRVGKRKPVEERVSHGASL
jgi:putative transposase